MNIENIFSQLTGAHLDTILSRAEEEGPGIILFRILKHPKVVDGKQTNCEMYYIEYGGRGWSEIEESLDTSQGLSKKLLNKYMSAPEKYLLLGLALSTDESASYTNFWFKLIDHLGVTVN